MRNNKTAGSNLEREVVLLFRKVFGIENKEDITTSRLSSREMDNCKVDVYGECLPVNIQCKNSQQYIKFVEIFDKYGDLQILKKIIRDKPLVILQDKTEKSEGGRFMSKGKYVTMELDVFTRFMKVYKRKKELEKENEELKEQLKTCIQDLSSCIDSKSSQI